MDFFDHPQFKEFEKEVNLAIKGSYNILIVSLPGSGVTFFIKKYLEKYNDNKVGYITDAGVELFDFAFLDLDFNKNEHSLKIADNYIKKARIKQKFAVVVNSPSLLDTDLFKKSTLSTHYYKTIWMKTMDIERTKILANDCSMTITKKKLIEILDLTGGIARLTRYFILNQEKLKLNYVDLLGDKSFKHVFTPTIELISKCNDSELEKLDIKKDGQFIGSLIKSYFNNNPVLLRYNLIINIDGSIVENDIKSSISFLRTETKIIQKAILNSNLITKEDISEIKWQKDSYDRYSDQAIKKTMQRINKKLTQFIFIAIPTIGYKLERK
jgi:hypothetical protein